MKKALIVDDEEQARLYLAKMIVAIHADMEIQMSSTPSEALFILERNKPDILFVDVEMPGMSGVELLQILREKHPSVPVVIVSAHSKFEYIQKALRMSAVDYLNKPVDPDELEKAINNAFEGDAETISPSSGDKVQLMTDKGVLFVNESNLLYFESAKRYAIVHFVDEEQTVFVRENLACLEKRLSQKSFKRVSRQYVVNVQHIKYVNKAGYIIIQNARNQFIKLERIYPEIIKEYASPNEMLRF